MPKDTIARAISKASGADSADYTETTFEGYGPDGIAVMVECATDNNNRTVANIRMYFNKFNGALGKDGSLQFIFDHKGVFLIEKGEFDEDELTMELIDAGAEDFESEEELLTVYTEMSDFGAVQKKLGELEIEAKEAGLQRIPNMTKAIGEKHISTFMKLIDALEDDDDVQSVYHNAEIADEVLEQYL